MISLLIIPACLGGGWLLNKLGLPSTVGQKLGRLVINIALPALILANIPTLHFEPAYAFPILMPWIVFALAIPFFIVLGRKYSWDKATTGGLILTAGLGNTSFIGIPVLQAIWGEAGVKIALLADQPGSFACLSTAGILVASIFSGFKIRFKTIAFSMLRFLPFPAFLVAAFLNVAGFAPNGSVLLLLKLIGGLVVPLALVAVGIRLRLADFSAISDQLHWGLLYKLILAPFIILLLYSGLGAPNPLLQGSVMEAAMGPMVTATLLAEAYGLQARLMHQILSVGVALSSLSLVVWWVLLQLIR